MSAIPTLVLSRESSLNFRPVVQGGMQWYWWFSLLKRYTFSYFNNRVGVPRLAAAVSEAGGLGESHIQVLLEALLNV